MLRNWFVKNCPQIGQAQASHRTLFRQQKSLSARSLSLSKPRRLHNINVGVCAVLRSWAWPWGRVPWRICASLNV